MSGQEGPGEMPVSGPSLVWATAMVFVENEASVVVCDVGALTDPGVSAVEALARVQLTAQRLGLEIRLRHASRELRDLLNLVGLCDVLPMDAASGGESSGQTE